VYFADGQTEPVEQIAKNLVETGLLQRGGKLILNGCNIAGDKDAQKSLYFASNAYGITIYAQNANSRLNMDVIDHWTFHPDGRPPTPPIFSPKRYGR
jgi:hypothetical protein